MFKMKSLFTFSLGLMIPVGLLVSPDTIFAQKYRVILPPRPQQPPALNNTVNSVAGASGQGGVGVAVGGFGQGGGVAVGGFGQGGGGGQQGGGQGQVVPIALRLNYGLPPASNFQPGGGQQGGGGGFGQGGGGGGFGQGGGGFGQGGGGFGQGGGGFGGKGGFGNGGNGL